MTPSEETFLGTSAMLLPVPSLEEEPTGTDRGGANLIYTHVLSEARDGAVD
jgi:hypothetical protein